MTTTQTRATAPQENRERVDTVYHDIRAMILSGQLKGGESLSQVRLAEHFKVSRGPIREAMRMLQNEGLIEAEANHRGRVATFSKSQMEEVCAALVLNVAAAIRSSNGQFDDADISRIVAITRELEATTSYATRQSHFRELILVICRFSGSQMTKLISGLLDRIAMFRQLHEVTGTSPPYPLGPAFEELREAANSRDTAAMTVIMVGKISNLANRALNFVDTDYRPDLLRVYADMAYKLASPSQNKAENTLPAEITVKIRGLPNSQIQYEILSQ